MGREGGRQKEKQMIMIEKHQELLKIIYNCNCIVDSNNYKSDDLCVQIDMNKLFIYVNIVCQWAAAAAAAEAIELPRMFQFIVSVGNNGSASESI